MKRAALGVLALVALLASGWAGLSDAAEMPSRADTRAHAADIPPAAAPHPAGDAQRPAGPHPAAGAQRPAGAASSVDHLTGELRIYAAASLQKAFDELATTFEQQHPALDVRPVVYDGSSTLAMQLIEGAPADVFASADETTMDKVTDAGLADDPELFASNTMVIVVPAGNPGGVEDLRDLGHDGTTVVLCATEVPCGAASRALIASAGVSVRPASVEQNVTAVLTKVATGEADAGLVYATDVRARRDVKALVPVGAAGVVNRYPIAALTDAGNPAAAAAFVDFVAGPQGRAALAELGFGQP